MNEKKQCDFFSTRALFSRILNFRKKSHFLLFISEIAQNVSTISYKGVSYKTIMSVSSYMNLYAHLHILYVFDKFS